MTLEIRRFADQTAEPWRNGRGVTREIISVPASAVMFDWRISIADVTRSGAFSLFPGLDRVLVLCQGPAMTIAVDGVAHDLVPYQPFRFSGDATTACRIGPQPTRDLNVMTRRGQCTATVSVLRNGGVVSSRQHATTVVLALSGTPWLAAASGASARLAPLDAAVLPPAADIRLDGDGHAAVIHIDIDDRLERVSQMIRG